MKKVVWCDDNVEVSLYALSIVLNVKWQKDRNTFNDENESISFCVFEVGLMV